VTGLLALVPVAVVAGVVALVQTTRRRQAGRGLAVGGLVAAALWTVGGVVAGILLVTGDWLDGSLGRVEQAGSARVGTCLRTEPAEGDVAEAVACTAEHDGEVYLVEELGTGAWPGRDDVQTRADDTCYDAFEGYVGQTYVRSAYDYGYYLPDRDEWDAGERRVVCVVVPFDGPIDGSVRGSGR
jgi:hypothetical protein